jgi:glutamate synthase domain-containing protein 2
MRHLFIKISIASILFTLGASYFFPLMPVSFLITGPIIMLGLYDMLQRKHTIRRNFPVIGHGRYLLEMIRPEINQYFIESNLDGRPFSRERRSVVYQRAKNVTDTIPFGTQDDVYREGYEWINHSLVPTPLMHEKPRVRIGGDRCKQPYDASVFNISAMSYGSLSKNAILALNKGASLRGFYHNTGEGGLSPYHLENGGDIVWQLGTGYFGARDNNGRFSAEEFVKRATLPQVKMIELKLSQGAKPGHGGILPARKVTPEIAAIRGVVMGKDVLSPPAHSAFTTPIELLKFLDEMRALSGGKPVGFKLCLGKRREFFAICKAMLETGLLPDYINVDGAEGGTGAAPVEFSNSVGTPLNDGLIFVHNALVGIGVRDKIRIICAGKIVTGFNLASKLALGADVCNAARGMLFALGCIQALRCNTNDCPTGVATQDPELVKGLDVEDKSKRVASFHKNTIHSLAEVLAAAGLKHPSELRPWHIQRRVNSTDVKHYGEIYTYVDPGALLSEKVPDAYARPWRAASASTFEAANG